MLVAVAPVTVPPVLFRVKSWMTAVPALTMIILSPARKSAPLSAVNPVIVPALVIEPSEAIC